MRTEQLHYLNSLSKYPSFNSASVHLNISFQALLRSINKLEDELGLTLLNRTPRGVQLTEDAQRLLNAANFLFSEIEDMQRKTQPQAELPITIPTTQSVVSSIFQNFIIASYQNNWKIRMLELPYEEINSALQNNLYRIIFSHQTYFCGDCMNPLPKGIAFQPAFPMEHSVMASRKFHINNAQPVSLSDLAAYPFAVLKRRDDEQAFLLQILLHYMPLSNIVIEENLDLYNQLIIQGVALGFSQPVLFKKHKHVHTIKLVENISSIYGFMWRNETVLTSGEQQAIAIIANYLQNFSKD